MNAAWAYLFWPSEETAAAVADRLRAALPSAGYTPFDPFNLLPAPAYSQAVRLFVAPAAGGWVRAFGEASLTDALALGGPGQCLYVALSHDSYELHVVQDGTPSSAIAALSPHLRPERSAETWAEAFSAPLNPDLANSAVPSAGLPFDQMPPEIQALADRVDTRQAQKLFDRLSGDLLRRAGAGADADAAHTLLLGQTAPDWDSPGGQKIIRLLDMLTIPPGWREPSFEVLRTAYPLHRRRQRLANARLYPGDAEAMAAVPNALDYLPVYGGRA